MRDDVKLFLILLQEEVMNGVAKEKGRNPLILNKELQGVEMNKDFWKSNSKKKMLDPFNYPVIKAHIFLILIPI